MNDQITFSQAIDGYLLYAAARRLSPHTIADYTNTFRKFHTFLEDDPPLNLITCDHIQRFLASRSVSNKTILNYHTGLSALWTWAEKERLVIENIVRLVDRPRPEKRDIIPLTQNDVRALLANLEKTSLYQRPGKRPSSHSLPCAERNRAIILLLLDTGVRSSELCQLTHQNLDAFHHAVTDYNTSSNGYIAAYQYSSTSNNNKDFYSECYTYTILNIHRSTNEFAYTNTNSYLDSCLSF